jgi:hypothetical protein
MDLLPYAEGKAQKVRGQILRKEAAVVTVEDVLILVFLHRNSETRWTRQEIAERLYRGDRPCSNVSWQTFW